MANLEKNRKGKRRPSISMKNSDALHRLHAKTSAKSVVVEPDTIKGVDDNGTFYNSHQDLTRAQALHRMEYYSANRLYWSTGGYGGLTDDESMIGDTDGIQDGAEGLAFLDRFLQVQEDTSRKFDHAMDIGAGAGRISKLVLLKRYGQAKLVEGDPGWSKRSRAYLGRKRAARCTFVQQRLDDLSSQDVMNWYPAKKVDLMWVQWTLQYLIDQDVVSLLKNLTSGLRPRSGIIVVKENRPYGQARCDRFQMDVPDGAGENKRFDITRPDNHHRLLFQKAGLSVRYVEKGVETNTYVLALDG